MTRDIIFYDIINRGSTAEERAWAPNPWKTRLTLGYKKIPFRTVWVEFPDIAPLCKKIGAEPTSFKPDGSPHYTLPVIHDPSSGKTISDSWNIAVYLDETYPDRPVLLPKGTRALQRGFIAAVGDVALVHIRRLIILGTWTQLSPGSQPFWRATREAAFGCKLEDVSAGAAREEHWAIAERGLHKVASWCQQNAEGGEWAMGDTISFADLFLGGWLIEVQRVAPEVWERIKQWDDRLWQRHADRLLQYAAYDQGEEYRDSKTEVSTGA